MVNRAAVVICNRVWNGIIGGVFSAHRSARHIKGCAGRNVDGAAIVVGVILKNRSAGHRYGRSVFGDVNRAAASKRIIEFYVAIVKISRSACPNRAAAECGFVAQ